MAKTCDICGKGPAFGNSVSHSNRKTRRTWKPNIQPVKVKVKGQLKKMQICVRCLKTLKKKGTLK